MIDTNTMKGWLATMQKNYFGDYGVQRGSTEVTVDIKKLEW